jgi:thiamine-phosphate pyrophosphorylase
VSGRRSGKARKVRGGTVDDGQWIDPEETRCRLIVEIGAGADLDPLFDIEAVAALLLRVTDEAAAREQVEAAHAAGRAAFLVDRVDLVQKLGADGVLLSQPSEVAAARDRLVRGELIGAVVGSTRHDAMVAGEDGADYVLFGILSAPPADGIAALAEHVAWWGEVAVLPSVVAGRFSADEVRELVAAGADFILPASDHDAQALGELARVLASTPVQAR